jgi:hypothetical protein
MFRYNGYLSLMEFRELTLQRLKRFVSTPFGGSTFDVRDYVRSEYPC